MSSKKAAASNVASVIKLTIPAGTASATPPIGPALGQKGVKAMDFCKQFNEATKHIQTGTPLPVLITVQPDRSFQFLVKTPTTSYLLKKAAGIHLTTTDVRSAQLSPQHIYEIAKLKLLDPYLSSLPLQSVFRMVLAVAKHIGIDIVRIPSDK